jgi:hypothetical protein
VAGHHRRERRRHTRLAIVCAIHRGSLYEWLRIGHDGGTNLVQVTANVLLEKSYDYTNDERFRAAAAVRTGFCRTVVSEIEDFLVNRVY